VHMLNQKETAIRAAKEMGRKYEDCNFVVCHIGGGVSVTAHRKGRAVDSTSIIMGEGPMTPTRAGALPAIPFMDLCYSGKWTRDEMYARLIHNGGFLDLLGTSSATDVKRMIESGNKYAKLVYDAFIYQIGKSIGAMAAVLNFDVDAILLGGGIVNDKYVVDGIREMCSKIAEIREYPGEFEMEALAAGALRALNGEQEVQIYDGIPVFNGFDHLK
ncbi:MAG: butyrate kinase, partial [Oscillospiraceae bacterium]|nr:butyrate kinase [Oscillospiraceae bacterium]